MELCACRRNAYDEIKEYLEGGDREREKDAETEGFSRKIKN